MVPVEYRILHISWHDFVSNDEVLHRTALFDVSYIVRKRRLGLFGHVARLRNDVPANQILRICAKTRYGERPSQEWRRTCGRPSTCTTWVHQICSDTGVSATEALLLAEDKPFWRTIATAGGSSWSLRVMIDLLIELVSGLGLALGLAVPICVDKWTYGQVTVNCTRHSKSTNRAIILSSCRLAPRVNQSAGNFQANY